MSELMLKVFLVVSLLGFVGCAAPEERTSGIEGSLEGDPGSGQIELPESKGVDGGPSHEIPPPVWLVVEGEAVQASYGEFCEAEQCSDGEPPEQASDLATMQAPTDAQAFVVVGSDDIPRLTAGVVGWGEAPEFSSVPGMFTKSGGFTPAGVPYFMWPLEAQRMPEGEEPMVEAASGGDTDGALTVFELESTGNPGDRRLSVFLNIGKGSSRPGTDGQAVYHWRLDPGQASATSAPAQREFPDLVQVAPDPLYPPEEPAETAFQDVEKTPLGGSPVRLEAGEGYLWMLDRKESPQGGASGPNKGKTDGKAMPPRDSILLKLDPDTREVLSAVEEPGFGANLEVGGGAVWLSGNEQRSIVRLDPETETTQTIGFGSDPYVNAIAATENGVWVSAQNGRNSLVARIDPDTGEVVAEIEVSGIASDVTVDEDTGDVWVTRRSQRPFEPGHIVRIDPATNTIAGRYKVEGSESEVVAASGGSVWVQSGNGAFSKLDPRKQAIEQVATLDPGFVPPEGMEVEAGTLWMLSPAGSIAPEGFLPATLTRLDLENGRSTVTTIPDFEGLEGYEPMSLAVGEGSVWVLGAGTLWRITA